MNQTLSGAGRGPRAELRYAATEQKEKRLKRDREESIEKDPRVRKGGDRQRDREREETIDVVSGQLGDPAQGEACSCAASPFCGHVAGGHGLPRMKGK